MKDHAVIVLHDKEKVLFVQRSKTKKVLPSVWAFPSGTVERGEKVEGTIQREAKEELGITVRIENIFATVELSEQGARLHFVLCALESGNLSIQEPDEIQSLGWHTFEEFFNTYGDDQIGHGLIYLRKNPGIWRSLLI